MPNDRCLAEAKIYFFWISEFVKVYSFFDIDRLGAFGSVLQMQQSSVPRPTKERSMLTPLQARTSASGMQ